MSYSVRRYVVFILVLFLVVPSGMMAQQASGDQVLEPAQLDQLLAPIALYPDTLLSQTLMASTYPLEVVQAARWSQTKPDLKGDKAVQAVAGETWDVSVKSLVAFPEVLAMMNEKLGWTQKVGDAFLSQQKDVLDSVQRLRNQAYEAGNLKSGEQQTIIVEQAPQQTIIKVEPADPQVIYVPSYNPTVVYGTWAYPAYPPVYIPPPPGYYYGSALATGFAFGVGVAAAGAIFGDCNWHGGDVDIDINRATNIDRSFNSARIENNKWEHNPEHRKGVAYRDQTTAQKYNRGQSANAQARESFRGRSETGRQAAERGGSAQNRDRSAGGTRDLQGRGESGARDRSAFGSRDVQGRRESGSIDRSAARHPSQVSSTRADTRPSGDRSAFGGYDQGSRTSNYSNRGRESMSSSHSGGGGIQRGGGSGGFQRSGGSRGGGRR
jgi:hypothetical protein